VASRRDRGTRGWRLRLVVLAALAGTVLSANVTSTAGAKDLFPTRGVGFTGGIQPQSIRIFGETFFQTTLAHFDHNGTGTILLAGNDAGTASTLVNDEIVIKVRHPNGSTAVFRHDYSHGCTSTFGLAPVDITGLFAVGSNRVTVSLNDVCGGESASDAVWITAR
jgi:hypothetical protein